MKRIFFALAICTLFLPVARQAEAAEVSIDFFYNNLSGGSWIEVADYGYWWQPDVAVNDPSWRPYADGYWAYTDVGWTWVSYEDFGWATYHYGRWARLADYGWVWVPGADLEWGPAWVSWRTGGDYIGWAPLPPRGPGIVYESQPIGGSVDIEFDIGPAYYNFCDVRYIGEPVLRERIVDVRQNVTYINQTVNVTNITYSNNVVYNYGPDINVINQHSSRPIQRLKLERQANVDVTAAVKSGSITKVQGNALVVAAPMKINKPAQPVAPPAVKAKVTQAKIEKGWSGVDANTQAQIKQKIKTEDRTKIPPPTGAGAVAGAPPAVSAAPTTSAAPTMTASPSEKGKRRGKPGEQAQPGVTTSPAGSPGVGASPTIAPEYGKPGKGKRGEQLRTTPPVTGPTAGPQGVASPPSATPEHGKPGKAKRGEQLRTTPPVTGPTAGPEGGAMPSGGKHKRLEETGTPPAGQAGPYGPAPGGKHKAESVNVPPSGPTTGVSPAAEQGEGKREGKKRGEKEASPVPSPQ